MCSVIERCCARRRCTLNAFLKRAGEQESQRDSATKPRVASGELPWVKARKESATPTGLWPWSTTNGVVKVRAGFSQGSSLLATPDWRTESRWDSPLAKIAVKDPCKVQRGR